LQHSPRGIIERYKEFEASVDGITGSLRLVKQVIVVLQPILQSLEKQPDAGKIVDESTSSIHTIVGDCHTQIGNFEALLNDLLHVPGESKKKRFAKTVTYALD
jgi:hypothetical protein